MFFYHAATVMSFYDSIFVNNQIVLAVVAMASYTGIKDTKPMVALL